MPPEVFADFLAQAKRLYPNGPEGLIAGKVGELAADYELEECMKVILSHPKFSKEPKAFAEILRAARRPSLAEQGLEQLKRIETQVLAMHGGYSSFDAIRRALVSLLEYEKGESNV